MIGLVRVLVIHLRKRMPKLDEKAKGELLSRAQEVLKRYPNVQFKGTFVDDSGVGVCEWEAPDAATVEKIVKELKAPYDKVVAVKQILP
jgi:hypothetical protein